MLPKLIYWSGPAGMLGGTLWVIGAVVTASKPRGCIGDECVFRTMRETGALDAVLFLLALLLLAVALIGLVARAWRTGRFGRLGRVSLGVVAVGAALVAIGMVLNIWDSGLVPAFIIPGMLVGIVGSVLVFVAVSRTGALPRWAGALLIVGALAMLGFNDQNRQVLMAVPSGIAWVAAGYALWSNEDAQARQPTRVR